MRYIINEETLLDIANAIRSKTGSDGLISGADIADYIRSIHTTTKPILEGLTVVPTGQEIIEIPPFGSDGFGIVTVAGDEYLLPENIRIGVTIYGVEGALATGDDLDTSDATATTDDIVDGASAYVNGVKLTGTHVCEADPILSTAYAMPTGEEFTLTPDEGVDGFKEVIVEGDEYLLPENILAGVTIYGVDGAVAVQDTLEVAPGVEAQNIKPDFGYTAISEVYVPGEPNLLPENILEGVTIFGVEGTAMDEEGFTAAFKEKKLQKDKVIMPGPYDITEEPDKGYLGFDAVTVKGDPNLSPENIKQGVSIFGVIGADNSSSGGNNTASGGGRMFVFPDVKLIFEETTT